MSERSFEELLPWYANGTLDDAERREVEQWLQDNPDAQLQLAEYEFLQETVSEVTEQEPVLRENLFDELIERIDAEEQQQSSRSAVESPSLMEQLRNWISETLQWNMTPAFARVAVVSQFAVVMALGAVLLVPTAEEGYEVLSGGDPVTGSAVAGVQADLAVDSQLPMGQFQSLLREHQARVIGGPGGLGVYRIAFDESADADRLLKSLKGQEGVTYLQRVSP